jgi:hypothetical protein
MFCVQQTHEEGDVEGRKLMSPTLFILLGLRLKAMIQVKIKMFLINITTLVNHTVWGVSWMIQLFSSSM